MNVITAKNHLFPYFLSFFNCDRTDTFAQKLCITVFNNYHKSNIHFF